MNRLKAVFWDYPQLTEEASLQAVLRDNPPPCPLYFWMLRRFLEHGRVVDTFRFFAITDIAENLPRLRLRPATLKKWKRLVEVYAHP